MLSFDEARQIVMSNVRILPKENVGMMDCVGRVLAEDIVSDMDMPPFDKSAVDGFACRISDLGSDLECIETIPAGKMPAYETSPGTCSKIMTGAMVPKGSDCVIMVEDTILTGNNRIHFTKSETSRNICYQGEDIKAGDVVLKEGLLIRPQHIAVLATAGALNPKVSTRVEVGILSTGDELVEPEHIPAPPKIRNSNAYHLMAQVSSAGMIARYGGIATDDKNALAALISDSLDRNDVVLLTGGVSMGEFDCVPEVLEKLGIEILFRSIAIQPGKPTVFGRHGNQFVFGLPGNPVSSFVIFELLVKPFLLKMMGCTHETISLGLPAGASIKKKKTSRKSFIPVRILDGSVFPIEYHGSAHINAYTLADGIITIEAGKTGLEKGEIADVRLI